MNEYAQQPYPEVVPGPDDARTAMLLAEDYAGMVSEMSAITQYVYADITISPRDEKVAKAFEQVSLAEMRHLELIGDAILTLGGDPRYASQGRYWSARYVDYASRPREALRRAIRAENEAIAQYRRHIALTRNNSVKRLLERIIMDEESHIALFTKLLDEMR